MERLKLSSSFIVRVHQGKTQVRISVFDLRTGQHHSYGSWEAFYQGLSRLPPPRGLR